MYCTHPVNQVNLSPRGAGFQRGDQQWGRVLAEAVRKRLPQEGSPTEPVVVALDGTHGAPFERSAEVLKETLAASSIAARVIPSARYLRPAAELDARFDAQITENRAFGRHGDACVADYFRTDAREAVRADLLDAAARGTQALILFGPGALWLTGGAADIRVYVDVTREFQQRAHRAGLANLGVSPVDDVVEKYKIAYFLEWPVWETYRRDVLPQMDWYVDANGPETVFAEAPELLAAVADVATRPLRVKPFFMPGVWGGQYLKQLARLPADMVNCAWGYEPIAPENSVLLGWGAEVMEIPFQLVVQRAFRELLGDRVVRLFGDYFPVRFDYLDTMDGGDLSCQVHPRQEYIREVFGEFLEQQESYYIMEAKKGAKVYLGLTDTCDQEEFIRELRRSAASGEPMEFTRFVQGWDSHKGDLFLIPTGTVHCAGKDNLVLEISATTWWFTFKLYDYGRRDLDGKPRPINIEHGVPNIDFSRRAAWVKEHLIPKPRLIRRQGNNEEYRLGGRPDLLFYVNRIHVEDEWRDDTDGEFCMLNLVEGDRVRIVSERDPSVQVEFGYAESYILPAVFGPYRLINLGTSACRLIKSGVAPEWDVSLLHESVRRGV